MIALNRNGRRLDGALDQQAMFGSALGSASDLLAVPKQIESFVSDKTFTGLGFAGRTGKLGRNVQPGKGFLDPCVDLRIAFDRTEGVPRVRRRKDGAIGPVPVMRDDA